jgi:hypothetical protein
MADTVSVGQEVEGRILDAVHRSNGITIEALRVLTDAIQPVTSVMPSVTPPLVYDFAEKLLASERKFAEDVLHLTERLTPAPAK